MTTLVASDLDRTLVYSAAALGLVGSDESAPPLLVAEVYEGVPLSFLTRSAEQTLVAVAAEAVFVPVTTRTHAQYRRIRLPRSSDAWAVVTNGAVVLHDGRPDEDWAASLRREVAERSAPLPDVERVLADTVPDGAVLRTRRAEDVFLYAIVDRAVLGATAVEELAAAVGPSGWTVSLQGRKLYVVPEPVRKERALAAVAERVGAERTVAAGDSLLDQGMLDWADRSIRPAHGELHDRGWTSSSTTVTSSAGVAAGQEIAEWFAATIRGTGHPTRA